MHISLISVLFFINVKKKKKKSNLCTNNYRSYRCSVLLNLVYLWSGAKPKLAP